MLISLRSAEFIYIGKTKDLHQRMMSHQSGLGSNTTHPEYLWSYSYFAYICGFNGNESVMFYIKRQWKESVNRLRMQGYHDPKIWSSLGKNDVMNLDLTNFGIVDTRSELRLILLFK